MCMHGFSDRTTGWFGWLVDQGLADRDITPYYSIPHTLLGRRDQ